MPKKTLPRIVAVTPGNKPMTLRIRWDKGDETLVDVSGMIESFRVYEPLRRSMKLFRQVRVGEHGTDIVWSDDIDMAADTLWRLAQEQAGVTLSPDAFNIGASVTLSRSTRQRRRWASAAAWSPITNKARSLFPVLSRWRRADSKLCESDEEPQKGQREVKRHLTISLRSKACWSVVRRRQSRKSSPSRPMHNAAAVKPAPLPPAIRRAMTSCASLRTSLNDLRLCPRFDGRPER